jgi:hypothetical protein
MDKQNINGYNVNFEWNEDYGKISIFDSSGDEYYAIIKKEHRDVFDVFRSDEYLYKYNINLKYNNYFKYYYMYFEPDAGMGIYLPLTKGNYCKSPISFSFTHDCMEEEADEKYLKKYDYYNFIDGIYVSENDENIDDKNINFK